MLIVGRKLIGDLSPLRPGGSGIVLREGGCDERRDDAAATFAGVSQCVSHEVDAATLLGRVHHLADGGLDSLVRVRRDELDAAQSTAGELAQERRPEGLGLGGADIHAQHLAASVVVDSDGENDSDGDDAAVLAHFHIGRVDPDVGPFTLDGAVEECLDPFVDLFAQARHLALRNPVHPHGLDQIVDGAGRNALNIGFLNNGRKRLLGHATRFEKAGKVAALAQLRDSQHHGPGARFSIALAVPIALDEPLGRTLAMAGSGHRADLQLHQAMGREADDLAQSIRVGGLLHQNAQVHHVVGHWLVPRLR